MIIVFISLAVIIASICILKVYKVKELNTAIERENQQREAENYRLQTEQEQLKSNLTNINNLVKEQTETLATLEEHRKTLLENQKQEAQQVYDDTLKILIEKLRTDKAKLEDNYTALAQEKMQQLAAFDGQIETAQATLREIEEKQTAYIKAQQRQAEIEQQRDYYRCAISEDDKSDIALLRDTQKRLIKKDVVDKVIYESYYKPAYDILISHVAAGKDKICGIYKITDLITGLVYIGQSVDCKTRWRDHLKASLAQGGKKNKLYQQMQESGQENFTFEILEEVEGKKLNEREAYWIEFYKARDYGLNSTRGNGVK